ncbi:MAG: SPOR domain-containing protein [Flavobacteriales bacterium]|nr:SPOR domain-containing protein [Flavobacteriales bacterium]
MVLERAIHDLLYAHDCVIVPGFGGFLTHYRSARLDTRQRMLHPPGKDLSFNRNLTRSDGLLVDEVARLEGTGHEPAKVRIGTIVEAWRARLEREGRLELNQLGTFFLDAERNLQFEPDRRVNHLKDAYGLRPVTAVPVQRPVEALPPPVVRVLTPAPPPVTEPVEEGRSSVLWAAAAVAGVLFMAGTVFVLGRSDNGTQWSGLNPFGTREALRYTARQVGPPPPEPAETADLVISDTAHGLQRFRLDVAGAPELVVDLGPAPVPVAVPDTTAVAVRTETFRYHVMGGCFSVKENAESYMAALRTQGYSPLLVDVKGGLHRVAIGSYPNRQMAEEALAAARGSQAPDAWLLVK